MPTEKCIMCGSIRSPSQLAADHEKFVQAQTRIFIDQVNTQMTHVNPDRNGCVNVYISRFQRPSEEVLSAAIRCFEGKGWTMVSRRKFFGRDSHVLEFTPKSPAAV